jgi:hypothetical protein
MSECGNAVSDCSSRRLMILTRLSGVLQSLPRMLVSRQIILFSLLLASPMGVRGTVVQFGGFLVVLVMRSVVITSGHLRYSRSAPTSCGLPWRVDRHGPSTRELFRHATFPLRCRLFMVFGGNSMSARRKFVLLGGLAVCVVHGFFYRCTATAACGMSALASLDDAISCAPVCFNKSFARAIFSDVSQWTESKTPPALMCPS